MSQKYRLVPKLVAMLRKFMIWLGILSGVLLPSSATATHLMGGEMTYTHVGTNGSGWHTYEVRVAIYRDCSSANTNQTDFDLIASLGVYLNGSLVSNHQSNLDASLIENILPEDPNSCAELPEDLCIERGEYMFTITLPTTAGNYVLSYQRCCRSPAIVNLDTPQDQGFTLLTEIPGTALVEEPNSSPVFAELPQAFVCNNLPFELDNSALDPDGDSLAYHVCSIYIGATPLAPIPAPPLGPPFMEVTWNAGFNAAAPIQSVAGIAIDPITGLLTGTPAGLGKYAIGVCVEEWRNGVLINSILRDFTLDVVSCALSAPFYAGIEPCNGLDVSFVQTSNPAETYAWDFGFAGPTGTSTEPEPVVTFPAPGIYEVELAYTNGDCSGETSFTVQAQAPWTVEIEATDPVCQEGGWWVELTPPEGIPAGAEVDWLFGSGAEPGQFGGGTPDGVLLPAGGPSTIQLITESYGCVESDQVTLQLDALPVADFAVLTPPCRGLTVEFANEQPDQGPFNWSFGDGSSGTGPNPVHVYSDFGPYAIQAIAGAGTACADTAWESFSVYPLDPFEAAFDVRPVISCDDTSRVQVTYLGQPADGLAWEFPGIEALEGSPVVLMFEEPGLQAGMVSLYHAGCDLTFEVPLEVEALEPLTEVKYVVPNVFSPNNDSKNERFELDYLTPDGIPVNGLTNSSFSTHRLAVYNRWGTLLFETGEALAGWWAQEASEGTYYVVVDSQHACATTPFHYHGEVTLVR